MSSGEVGVDDDAGDSGRADVGGGGGGGVGVEGGE